MLIIDKFSQFENQNTDHCFDYDEMIFCMKKVDEIRYLLMDTFRFISNKFEDKVILAHKNAEENLADESNADESNPDDSNADDSKLIYLYPQLSGDPIIDRTIHLMKTNKSARLFIQKYTSMVETQLTKIKAG